MHYLGLSNVSLSSFDASTLIAGLAMPPLSHDKETYSSYFRDWTLVYQAFVAQVDWAYISSSS
jgi:hypothetical protein